MDLWINTHIEREISDIVRNGVRVGMCHEVVCWKNFKYKYFYSMQPNVSRVGMNLYLSLRNEYMWKRVGGSWKLAHCEYVYFTRNEYIQFIKSVSKLCIRINLHKCYLYSDVAGCVYKALWVGLNRKIWRRIYISAGNLGWTPMTVEAMVFAFGLCHTWI